MPFQGLNIVHESNKSIYFIGSRTGILIQEINKVDAIWIFWKFSTGL